MANVTETSTWESGIYQLETTDPVEGGELGISNLQARLLGNRTKWLYDQVVILKSYLPKNRGIIFNYNPGAEGIGFSLSRGGDISSAVIQGPITDYNSIILCTMTKAMANTNYKVLISARSNGTIQLDNHMSPFVYKQVSTTQFLISNYKATPSAINTDLYIDVIQL